MDEIDEMLDIITGLLGIICRRVTYRIGEGRTDEDDQSIMSAWEILNRHGRLCDLAGDATETVEAGNS